jgi:predicted regulator of Ras-like GTPase activity (Roadblock/LC7/MglB family)
MHWLAEQIRNLQKLAERHIQYRDLAALEVGGSDEAEKEAREAFLEAVRELVAGIAGRPGVEACLVSHDGLLVEAEGNLEDLEPLAAMAQSCFESGARTAESLELGKMQQMLVIGEQQKIALFRVGHMVLGILAMSETNLAQVLATPPAAAGAP